jgi:hypothetical protein
MNSDATYGLQGRRLTRQAIRLAAILFLSTVAFAQYGGGGTVGTMGTPGTPGASTPSYGHGKAIGIGVGAAAVGVGAIYLMTHRGSTIVGCTEMADDGLSLRDDKTKRTLTLVPGATDVKPGERVELKGKIKKSAAGNQNFLVKKVAKDFGECHTQANGGAESSLGSQGR